MAPTEDAFGPNPYASSGYQSNPENLPQMRQAAEWEKLHQKYVKQLNTQQPSAQFHGMGYSPMAPGTGVPLPISQGYGQAGQYILRGSVDAEEELRKKYEAMLRSRAGAMGMARAEASKSVGNQLHGAGISPELMGIVKSGQDESYLSRLGAALGEPEADLHGTLAELFKGTGTELAGLKQNESGSALNYLVGKAGVDAAGKSSAAEDIASVASLVKLFM